MNLRKLLVSEVLDEAKSIKNGSFVADENGTVGKVTNISSNRYSADVKWNGSGSSTVDIDQLSIVEETLHEAKMIELNEAFNLLSRTIRDTIYTVDKSMDDPEAFGLGHVKPTSLNSSLKALKTVEKSIHKIASDIID